MSALKQRLARIGVTAGVLVASTAAIMAVGGVTAGSAMATTCPNSESIAGEGSSLQKIAQLEVWNPGYNGICSNKPKITYTSTSSGSGLTAMGFNGGVLNKSFQFIGTDDGPNSTQIASAESAVSSKTKPVIVPVSQTAIAAVIHPPANCHFETGTGITYEDLNKVFGGNGITNWNQFTNILGGTNCNKAITRVVRAEGSGTTYQFKNYLSTLETKEGAPGLPCTTEGTTAWGGLLTVGPKPAEKPNTVWPACSGSSPIVTAAGGGAVAETVAANVGDIGYASLPDTKAKSAEAADLQNGIESEEPVYAEPGNSTTKTARCVNARYTVPAAGRTTGSGIAVDWSTVFGAQPEIGGVEYPLCTLTYDAGWDSYTEAGFTAAQGAAVAAYINYEVGTGATEGQTALSSAGKWYSKLPTAGGAGSATDVQSAAEWAASKVN